MTDEELNQIRVNLRQQFADMAAGPHPQALATSPSYQGDINAIDKPAGAPRPLRPEPYRSTWGTDLSDQPPTSHSRGQGAMSYASWGKRVGSFALDSIIPYLPAVLFLPVVPVLGSLLYLAGLGFVIWNQVQQGNTGQSIGKRLVGTRLVRLADGHNVGAGLAIGRWFIHIVDGLTFGVGYLWPLWDERRQTFADKLVGTVVIDA